MDRGWGEHLINVAPHSLFLSSALYSYGLNTFIRSRSSFKNPTRIQTIMGKVLVCTRFQTKKAKNHTLWGGIDLYGLYKGVPPPGIHLGLC